MSAKLRRFRAAIVDRFGLWFDDTRLDFLAEVLRDAAPRGHDCDAYIDRLEAGTSPRAELRTLASALTIGETYFFRNVEQYHALREVALPAIARAREGLRRVRVLSAGCSTGEEPYSLAMMLREHFGGLVPPWAIEVRGVDVDVDALARAREGRYSRWSVRDAADTPASRWLAPSGRGLVLDPQIRSMVELVERNLLDDDPILWQPQSYDVVFCRNVLMYFTSEHSRRIVTRLVDALAPGGWLFLGHAESLRGLGSALELCHTHGTFYYRRSRDASRPVGVVSMRDPDRDPLACDGAAADGAATGVHGMPGWQDEIDAATSRVRTLLAAAPGGEPERATSRGTPSPEADPARDVEARISAARALLERERYVDALAVLDELGEATPDARLLRAVLLTHGGAPTDAEAACRSLVATDDAAAEAHFLLALCAERRGDLRGAADHDRIAIHLDTGFAMPRLHLGLMARRRGELDAARRELGQALALLHDEPAARLSLFGGGFRRDALLSIAKGELVACGGRP